MEFPAPTIVAYTATNERILRHVAAATLDRDRLSANPINGFPIPIPEALLQLSSSIRPFVVITLLFALIYKVLPELKIEWRDVLLGSVVTSALCTAGKLAICVYLG